MSPHFPFISHAQLYFLSWILVTSETRDKARLPLCTPWRHTGGIKVDPYSSTQLLTSALDGGEGLVSRSSHLIPDIHAIRDYVSPRAIGLYVLKDFRPASTQSYIKFLNSFAMSSVLSATVIVPTKVPASVSSNQCSNRELVRQRSVRKFL